MGLIKGDVFTVYTLKYLSKTTKLPIKVGLFSTKANVSINVAHVVMVIPPLPLKRCITKLHFIIYGVCHIN